MHPRSTIVVAEDDDAEYDLLKHAFEEARLLHSLVRLRNGQEVIDYLLARGKFADRVLEAHLPCIVLLDMNMPVKDGKTTLEELKRNPKLKTLPVIMLTGTRDQEEVIESYKLGANAFIRKPFDFYDFMRAVGAFKLFWLDVVELPPALDLPGPSV